MHPRKVMRDLTATDQELPVRNGHFVHYRTRRGDQDDGGMASREGRSVGLRFLKLESFGGNAKLE